MKVVVAGGNGFIGHALTKELQSMGDQVIWLSYQAGAVPLLDGVTEFEFNPNNLEGDWVQAVAGCDAVVNLSGSNLAVRWNPAVKEMLLNSRVSTARALIAAISQAHQNGTGPSAYLGACGIGIFGDRGDQLLTEDDSLGSDWLSKLAQTWEAEGLKAGEAGVRAVVVRTGLVLGNVGLMPRMVLPMKMFVGGPLMPGTQWMSWIHLRDIAGVYAWAVHTESISGPINAVAPNPVRSRDFSASLGRALRRPSWFPVPKFALKLILGEVAPYMLFSQHASSKKIVDAGYQFKFPELLPALKDVIKDM